MADNSPLGQWVLALGGLQKSGKKEQVCKAFAAAVKKWCRGDADTRGKEFADVVFDKLKGAGDMSREVPILMQATEAGGKATIGVLEDVADGASGHAGVANSIMDAAEEAGASGAGLAEGMAGNTYRNGMNMLTGIEGEGAYGLKFADGAFADGQLLEIKSPMDKFSPGQAQSYNSASKKTASGKPLAVASCQSCENANCPSASQCAKTRYA